MNSPRQSLNCDYALCACHKVYRTFDSGDLRQIVEKDVNSLDSISRTVRTPVNDLNRRLLPRGISTLSAIIGAPTSLT